MEQKSAPSPDLNQSPQGFRSTRILNVPQDTYDPKTPRLGRRESEPHSEEVSYLHDVLETNFPGDRTMWDLHHYFIVEKEEIDFQIDISFFKGLDIPHNLSSYRASKYNNRVPTLGINILSKSTWLRDVGEHLDFCRALNIPEYAIFAPFDVASAIYRPPFLRVYVQSTPGNYEIKELHAITLKEGGEINPQVTINLGETLPFKLGIMERQKKHEENKPLFRLLLLDCNSGSILKTKYEQEKARADGEKARADKLFEEIQKLKQNK